VLFTNFEIYLIDIQFIDSPAPAAAAGGGELEELSIINKTKNHQKRVWQLFCRFAKMITNTQNQIYHNWFN